MTTITIDRATVEQALEALEGVDGPITALLGSLLGSPDADAPGAKVRTAITALRAALAQQKDPTDPGNDVDVLREHVRHLERRVRQLHAQQAEPVAYTTGHCENHKQKGGCQLHNLQCGWPDCDRKPTTAPPQQAEPVAWLQPKTVDAHTRPDLGYETCSKTDYGAFSVYTAPPQRKPLTEEEIERIGMKHVTLREVIRAVERAHGIKE